MIGGREIAASYGPKSSMVLCEARLEAWVRGSGQVSDDVCGTTAISIRRVQGFAPRAAFSGTRRKRWRRNERSESAKPLY